MELSRKMSFAAIKVIISLTLYYHAIGAMSAVPIPQNQELVIMITSKISLVTVIVITF